MLIHASREQHRVSSGSINEPYLVDPVELEVGEHAEGAVLSSRTACSGAFCTSKHHQSIMSSIQRHVGGAIRQPAAALRTSWRAQILRDSSAVWPLLRAPASAIGVRRRGRTEIKCRASGWDGAVLLTFREGFRSPVKASAATRLRSHSISNGCGARISPIHGIGLVDECRFDFEHLILNSTRSPSPRGERLLHVPGIA